MEKKEKYQIPEMEAMELFFEGVVCESGGVDDPDNFTPNPSNPFGA